VYLTPKFRKLPNRIVLFFKDVEPLRLEEPSAEYSSVLGIIDSNFKDPSRSLMQLTKLYGADVTGWSKDSALRRED